MATENDFEAVVVTEPKAKDIFTLLSKKTEHFLMKSMELTLNFKNVSYVNNDKKSKPVRILHDTYGEFKSGRLTAILGASGAGKTSMLNVLSGFKTNGVTGTFEINERSRNLLTFRKMASYIPQEFALLELLTVQETIRVSTDLKLPMELEVKEKLKIIDDILQILNMEKCRHTLVKNLSGGERKRLSIANELVTNPPIMFFDEPTSGLDSIASLQIIDYLRRLANYGRIIVCVIHQPSSRLMKLFDDVMVMSHGEVLYCGTQLDMLPNFERFGYICPTYYNPADFVLEIGSQEKNENIIALIEHNKRSKTIISHENSQECEHKQKKDEDDLLSTLRDKTQTKNIDGNEISNDYQSKQCIIQHVIIPKEQVNIWRQFTVLTMRSLRSMSRNLLAVQLRLIMHLLIGVLMGFVFWNIGNDAAKVLTNCSCIFFMMMFIFFGNAMPSILLCPSETAVFIREYLNGYYSLTGYYLAKVIADIPMQFICPTIFIVIIYHMTGQPIDIERFVMCWIITLLMGFIGHFIGLTFGSAMSLQMAVFLVPGTCIPFLIFSGFFIRIHELSTFLRPLSDISFFRYTMEGFAQAIYGYNREDLLCETTFCYFKSPAKFLSQELDMGGERYGIDIGALLIWIVCLKLAFFLTLVVRIKRAQ